MLLKSVALQKMVQLILVALDNYPHDQLEPLTVT